MYLTFLLEPYLTVKCVIDVRIYKILGFWKQKQHSGQMGTSDLYNQVLFLSLYS